MYTDPIADMLTRIRNGQGARKMMVKIPASKLKKELARVLKEQGYIANYRLTTDDNKTVIKVYLKYGSDDTPVIREIQRVSKPGRRIYADTHSIPWVIGGMGINILTTSRGLMTGREARRAGIGGEILCNVL
jgi:small subunit ribosomal protein S8